MVQVSYIREDKDCAGLVDEEEYDGIGKLYQGKMKNVMVQYTKRNVMVQVSYIREDKDCAGLVDEEECDRIGKLYQGR